MADGFDDLNEEQQGMNIDTDFNVDDEYKPEPLIPAGIYHAASTSVKFDPAQQAIAWTFVLHDNGGLMSDGETGVDGSTVFYRNWLPRPGDESEMNTSGKATKRQSKINMLKQFSTAVGLDMSTPQVIIDALTEQTWLGLEVDLTIATREWEGKIFNDVKKVTKSSMY
jgi:hypothetical protein